MIDPVHSLAFSIQSSRGVFAVLVGSGMSRAAKIPTGWEVTLDLTRKLASLYGETCDADPELWYRKRFGRDIDYSELLDALAQTSAERQTATPWILGTKRSGARGGRERAYDGTSRHRDTGRKGIRKSDHHHEF